MSAGTAARGGGGAHGAASAGGAAYALAAYAAWGLVPLYWRALRGVGPVEVMAHRVLWSLLFVAALAALAGRLAAAREALGSRRTLATLLATTALIGANWGLFIWAVQRGRLLQASLGYFMNPLVNVVLGVAVLRERLRPLQTVAVGLAALGVLVTTVAAGVLPWLSLVLAVTFGLYGLLRKTAPVDALTGLLLETTLLAPLAAAYVGPLEASGRGAIGAAAREGDLGRAALLATSGVVTAVPLLWFTAAARRLPLSTLGFFQYVSPTLQFVLAITLFGEPMTTAQGAAFAFIWVALAVFSVDARRAARGAAAT